MGFFSKLFKKNSDTNTTVSHKHLPEKSSSCIGMKIVSNTIPPQQNYDFLNDNEKKFFQSFSKQLMEANLSPNAVKLTRLSNGGFNVDYSNMCYVGKINLCSSSKIYMQYLRGATTIKDFYNISVEQCIEYIPYWIRYIKYCKRN